VPAPGSKLPRRRATPGAGRRPELRWRRRRVAGRRVSGAAGQTGSEQSGRKKEGAPESSAANACSRSPLAPASGRGVGGEGARLGEWLTRSASRWPEHSAASRPPLHSRSECPTSPSAASRPAPHSRSECSTSKPPPPLCTGGEGRKKHWPRCTQERGDVADGPAARGSVPLPSPLPGKPSFSPPARPWPGRRPRSARPTVRAGQPSTARR
jgi:hypothetical protein